MAANSTPSRASPAPAATDWRSPRAVSSRSSSGFESWGTASPWRRSQSCWATLRNLPADAESQGPAQVAGLQRQRVAARLEPLARQAQLVAPGPREQADAPHALGPALQRSAHPQRLVAADREREEDLALADRRLRA